ncbi:MAG: hypothetical protein JWN71_3409 [Xanthobacteraceae bacterium]|nr:hypothetical protein [Xanthobacteraceae bacterium]
MDHRRCPILRDAALRAAPQDEADCAIYRPPPHGIGSAVVDLIFSIAKRDVTFFSGTAAMSFL